MTAMDNILINNVKTVDLYLTTEHNCSYLADNIACTLFVDSEEIINKFLYQYLLEIGFRRSGNFVYRPHCKNCTACVSIRLPVKQFTPRRAQRRCWQRVNNNLQVIRLKPSFRFEHYALYQRYTATRHTDGDMSKSTPNDYMDFLTTDCCPGMFAELRYDKQLIAVAVTDVLPNALSAVYTFFDPDYAHYSPGVLAILWQIQEAQQRGMQYLYLGYWIKHCQKMCYKDQYRPLEAWNGKYWQQYNADELLEAHSCIY